MINVRVEFRDKKEEEFAKLREKLGLTNDTEVVRFALNHCYQEFVEAGTLAVP